MRIISHNLSSALPGSVGAISRTADTFNVSISWDEDSSGAVTADDPVFQVRFEP